VRKTERMEYERRGVVARVVRPVAVVQPGPGESAGGTIEQLADARSRTIQTIRGRHAGQSNRPRPKCGRSWNNPGPCRARSSPSSSSRESWRVAWPRISSGAPATAGCRSSGAVLFQERRPLPDAALTRAGGARFGATSLAGHWTFLFFGFVNCPDICPTTLATLATVEKSLGRPAARRAAHGRIRERRPCARHARDLARYVAHFDPAFEGRDRERGRDRGLGSVARSRGHRRPSCRRRQLLGRPFGRDFPGDPDSRVAALFGTPHEAGAIARDFRRILAARQAG
jgi:protein SCO1/2